MCVYGFLPHILCLYVPRLLMHLPPPPPPPLTAPLQNEYRHTVIQLAFLVAVLYTAVGIFRLGFLIRFLRSVGR
jgi:hypothetical protein